MSTKKMVKSIMESRDQSREIVALLTAHEENTKWVARNLVELVREFPDSYVAVRNKEVVMHDKNLLRLIRRLKSRFENISDVAIEHVTDKPIKFLF